MGPTGDDLSAFAAAQAAGVELELNQAWLGTMTDYFARINRPMAESNIKQAMLPEGATAIDNPVGTACGFSIELNQAIVMFTPGVPFEFKKMVKEQILPILKERFPQVQRLACNKIYTFGLGESGIADSLSNLNLPDSFSLGYRSYMPFIEVKVFSPYQDPHIEQVVAAITEQLKDNVLGINHPLIEVVGELLQAKQWQLSLFEQATGGELARQMYQSKYTEQFFTQSRVDNKAQPLEQLDEALVLADNYRCETNADVTLSSIKLTDGGFALILSTLSGGYAQSVKLKRDYPIKAQQALLATVFFGYVKALR